MGYALSPHLVKTSDPSDGLEAELRRLGTARPGLWSDRGVGFRLAGLTLTRRQIRAALARAGQDSVLGLVARAATRGAEPWLGAEDRAAARRELLSFV